VADASNTLAALLGTQGSWDRRSQEWQHQIDIITLEIQQIKRQLLASARRRAIALQELNINERQSEHSAEVLDFLRDKFTKQGLYLFLQQETASLYRQSYNMALKVVREAQSAFWYERGDTRRDFLEGISWNSLHEGLMAGERLELALQSMDQSYMELNCREYELTKMFSLRLHFPLAFLELKTRGSCEIEIPEWMFDLDYPTHYMRRIRNITLTVPCVSGPYTGIHCRAQLLSSSIRYKPLLPGPEACCCAPHLKGHCEHDLFFIKRYSSTEAIAVSSAIDDGGLFELNFRDERYLPFEFRGAISKWRFELPPENNDFDFDSLSDFVLKLNYTSREGGPELGRWKNELISDRVPGNGLRYFDVRHEFQDAWPVFASKDRDRREEKLACEEERRGHMRDLELRFTRNMFPLLTCNRSAVIKRIHIFIDTDEHCGDHIRLQYLPGRKRRCYEDDGSKEVVCRLSAKCCAKVDQKEGGCCGKCEDSEESWAKGCHDSKDGRCCCATIFHGILEDIDICPLESPRDRRGNLGLGRLRLPSDLGCVREAYLVCEYLAIDKEKALCCGNVVRKRLGLC
jgi:hypothetical protein